MPTDKHPTSFELITVNMIPSFLDPYCLISCISAAKAKLCPKNMLDVYSNNNKKISSNNKKQQLQTSSSVLF